MRVSAFELALMLILIGALAFVVSCASSHCGERNPTTGVCILWQAPSVRG